MTTSRPRSSCSTYQQPSSAAAVFLSQLRQMPPSAEILDFYHKKLESFEFEERKLLKRISQSRKATAKVVELESVLDCKVGEIRELQKTLVDLQGAFNMERKRVKKLETENDRLRILDHENNKKIHILLELCGQSETELMHKIDQVDLERRQRGEMDQFLPDRIKEMLQVDAQRSSRKTTPSRSYEGLKLDIVALESQFIEQEKLHMEQTSMLENERRLAARSEDELRAQFEVRYNQLAKYILQVDSQQEDLCKELIDSQSKYRKSERDWAAEKECLLRKLQVSNSGKFGESQGLIEGGYHSEQRTKIRQGKEIRLEKQIKELNTDLAERQSIADGYRARLLAVDKELEKAREENRSLTHQLKKRTKSMVDEVSVLKERYDLLDKRKKQEIEGYKNDVALLQRKIKTVEQQIVSASIAKVKEHEYLRKIKTLEAEIEDLKKTMRKSGLFFT